MAERPDGGDFDFLVPVLVPPVRVVDDGGVLEARGEDRTGVEDRVFGAECTDVRLLASGVRPTLLGPAK